MQNAKLNKQLANKSIPTGNLQKGRGGSSPSRKFKHPFTFIEYERFGAAYTSDGTEILVRKRPQPTERKRILIVEDEAAVRDVFALMLRKAGFKVAVAEHGLDALRFLAQSVPDLILMDIEMPLISGLTLAADIKADPTMCDVPIVVVTGHPDLLTRASAPAVHYAGYIIKPIDLASFTDQVAHYLNSKTRTN